MSKKVTEQDMKIDEILNSFPDYMVIYNGESGKILFVNEAFAKVLNIDHKIFIGSDITLVNQYLKVNIFDENFKIFNSPLIGHSLSVKFSTIPYKGNIENVVYFTPTPLSVEDRFKDGIINRGVNMINAFTLSYLQVLSVDIKNDRYFVVSTDANGDKNMKYDGVASKMINNLFKEYSVIEGKKGLKQFIDLNTLTERLAGINKINYEFVTKRHGYIRIGFICTDRDNMNIATNALFTIRVVDEERRKTKELQSTVKDALSQARSANDVKTNFLTKIGSDLKNPLNSIVGMASITKARINDIDFVSHSLDKIISSSQRLVTMFTEVLEMTNIETGNVTFAKEDIEIPELLTQLINLNKQDIIMHHHSISICSAGINHEQVVCDKLRLQQILNNVLKNAIQYTNDGGKIKIAVKENEVIEGKYGCYDFIIEDNGIGMNQEFISIATEPFVRGIKEEIGDIEGAGLGLSIVKSYVQTMGGTIDIESSKGKGTKVIISLKLELNEYEEEVGTPFFEKKVLLLSNNKRQTNCDSSIIKNLSGSVRIATNAEEAYKEIKKAEYFKKPFDYVIATYMTSNMSGIEEIKKLRKYEDIAIPEIIMTHYDVYSIEKEIERNNIKYLIKEPLSKKRLAKFIKDVSGIKETANVIVSTRKDKEMKGKKVLIVEDNEISSKLTAEVLEKRGMEIFLAKNGMEALSLFQKSEMFYYDIILMDIQMPIMNGYQATMAIRSLDRDDAKSIPILALTASSFAEDISSALMAGMSEHIAKPINNGTLYLTLNKWFVGEYAHRKVLELRAEIDQFTGVFNKTATFERIDSYLSNDVVPLSAMLVIDLDGFKIINDTLGHTIGDKVIKETIDSFKGLFREKDIVGRFGGDEFIVFMKDIQSEEIAYKRAELVKASIEKTFDGRYNHHLTASIGLAYVEGPSSVNKVFIAADNALYEAKRSGKNKIVFAK